MDNILLIIAGLLIIATKDVVDSDSALLYGIIGGGLLGYGIVKAVTGN